MMLLKIDGIKGILSTRVRDRILIRLRLSMERLKIVAIREESTLIRVKNHRRQGKS